MTCQGGRRTKTQNFIAALDSTGMLLFQQLDSGSFAKLQVNWARLSEIMCGHGGEAVFGGWAIWGNPFDLRHLQQHWEDKAFHDIFPSNSFVSDMNPHVRHTVVSLNESINLSALRSYALQQRDRRPDVLDAYLRRHDSTGDKEGEWC